MNEAFKTQVAPICEPSHFAGLDMELSMNFVW